HRQAPRLNRGTGLAPIVGRRCREDKPTLRLSPFITPGYHASMYEHFEHTADLGLRVQAADLNSLFAEAAEALSVAIAEDVTAIQPREAVQVRIGGTDLAYLLLDWLKEWLLRFEVERRLFRRFEVKVTEEGLEGTAWGEPFDPERHPLSHEVKAITYHGLRVERAPEGGWLAEVIVDI